MAGNPGRNVFYMLPLILGIIGLLYQAFAGKNGIEQFWVTFFLFFMTGIAIVIYLNQTPYQPRERDYAYAGLQSVMNYYKRYNKLVKTDFNIEQLIKKETEGGLLIQLQKDMIKYDFK